MSIDASTEKRLCETALREVCEGSNQGELPPWQIADDVQQRVQVARERKEAEAMPGDGFEVRVSVRKIVPGATEIGTAVAAPAEVTTVAKTIQVVPVVLWQGLCKAWENAKTSHLDTTWPHQKPQEGAPADG